MSVWVVIGCLVSALFAWVGGFCFGWLKGEQDTERRWSDACKRSNIQ